MDFITYVDTQRDKLVSFNYPNLIWNTINNYESEQSISASRKQEYKYHLPIDIVDFLKSCNEKLGDVQEENGDLFLGDQLRIYVLTFIYWCLINEEENEDDIPLQASQLYIRLISLKDNICFNPALYKICLEVTEKYLDSDISQIVKQLKVFISTQIIEPEYKGRTLDILLDIIESRSSTVIQSFEIESSPKVDHEALLCIHALTMKEQTDPELFTICTNLFRGVRTTSKTKSRQGLAVMQTNIKTLIKELHPKILHSDYPALKNALAHDWTIPDMEYFQHVVDIMNDMDMDSYQSLLEKLRNMIISKNDVTKKNLIGLSTAILANPSRHYSTNKLEVLAQTLIRSIIMNTCSSNSDVCDTAVEAIAHICSDKNNLIDKSFKVILESNLDMINKDTFLKRLKALVDIKWKHKTRNKNICIILCYLMTHINVDEMVSVQIMRSISEEATPFHLKPCLHTLTSVYVETKRAEKEMLAHSVYDVLYKMSMHPAGTSSDFIKHMFSCMMYPVKISGNSFPSDMFIVPLISEDYNFNEFYKKCDSLSLIRPEHIKKLITQLNEDSCAHLKLMCTMLDYVVYNDYLQLTEYILSHFDMLVNNVRSKYHFCALNKILSRRRGPIGDSTGHQKLYELKDALIKCVKEQQLPSKAISNAVSLLKTIINCTNSSVPLEITEACDESLNETLQNIHNNSINLTSILYAAELALLINYVPQESSRLKLNEILKYFSSSGSSVDQEQNYDLWTFCLILQTALAMQLKDSVDATIHFLRCGIKSKSDVVKLTSIRLLYDISNMILRNFENLIQIMFSELLSDSLIIKKTCVGYIEKLVRDEYLRLDASQFLKLMCLLRDQNNNMDEHMKKLLAENFIISHQSTIAKNFVSMIVHFNKYKKHPAVHIDKHVLKAVEKTNQSTLKKKDMYSYLFKPLTKKSQFNVLKELSTQVFDNVIEENMRCDSGYWDVINDAILIIKISSSDSHTLSEDKFYAKIMNVIEKSVIERNKQYSEKPKYIEFQGEIKQITQTLLMLLFFNESDHFLRNIKTTLFDAIMYWTNHHLPDIINLIHEESAQRLKLSYSKLPSFYKKEIIPPRYNT